MESTQFWTGFRARSATEKTRNRSSGFEQRISEHTCFMLRSQKKQGKSKTAQRFTRFQESDYMDPNQGLCLGALFDIAATNGFDMGRRLCIFGFCRSIGMLSDVVEDTVLEHGGEVNRIGMDVQVAILCCSMAYLSDDYSHGCLAIL